MVKVVSMKTVRGNVTVELDNGRRYHLKSSDLVGFPISEDTEIDDPLPYGGLFFQLPFWL